MGSDSAMRDLTSSKIDRQNILNNDFAIEEIKKTAKIMGIIFEDKVFFTKNMVATFFGIDLRTVERYVSNYPDELLNNGYEVLKGKRLKEFITSLNKQNFAPDIDVGNISSKTQQLGIFDFKSFLNLAMLLVESENAKILRGIILDIVIDLINNKTGGATKYINQRDKDFIGSYLLEEDYRKEFTDVLRDYVDMGNTKYAIFTDKIYQSIFKEKAKEYKKILNLQRKDRVRDTFYSEILDLIASYECGLAANIKKEAEEKGRKLNNWEVYKIFSGFEELPHWKPLIIKGRTKMASRDLALRDAFHKQLEIYISPLEKEEYNRFLGNEADEMERLMAENKDVLKRLKERE